MKNYFYVGQKVSDQRFGDGVVTKILDSGDDYPIIVKFGGGECGTYTPCGRITTDTPFPSLSQQPHKPLEYEEINPFKKGDVVWFRKPNWSMKCIGIYLKKEGDTHFISTNITDKGLTLNTRISNIDDIELYKP